MPKIDARAIHLYSRNPQENGFPQSLDPKMNYSFCFYDAVKVNQIEPADDSILLAAYEASLAEMDAPGKTHFPYQQVLFAFKDVAEDASSPASEKNIEDFWKCTEYPLLFISLINLNNSKDLDSTLERIEGLFDKNRCLTYLTFDHCDVLLFFRGDSFREFTDNIFRLNYGGGLINDTITLFTFASETNYPLAKLKEKTGELFGAYIRLGVKHYEGCMRFIEKAEKIDAPSGKQPSSLLSRRLLGRNDMTLYYPAASLCWLAKLKEILNEETDFWYTTYDLAVLIPYDKNEELRFDPEPPSPDSPAAKFALIVSSIEGKMGRYYEEFQSAYLAKCKDIGMAPDGVWLRWLKSASALAVTFFKSRLSVDLGTCLVPQIFGLLQYGTALFKSEKLRMEHMDHIREIFIEVFVNISILVDSLNHSNRQFIQVPSYNSISFEMPPKLMAYFTALAHRLAQALQDRPYLYSITISPKFACELDVSSFAVHNVLSRHEIITISLEERSIYQLQLTTETMAHEISHFVGDDNRCRELRRECIIKCALAELVDDLIFDVQTELLSNQEIDLIGCTWETLDQHVETLWSLWNSLDISPKSKSDDYLREVYLDILNLPKHLDEQPSLRHALFDALNSILQAESSSSSSSGSVFWKTMAANTSWKTGRPPLTEREFLELQEKDEWDYHRTFIASDIYRVMRDLLSRYAVQNQRDAHAAGSSLFCSSGSGRTSHIRYMFSETFADLQAILLFNMTWEDYCRLLLDKSLKDAPPRMLAVAKTLREAGPDVWPEAWPEDWPEMHSWKEKEIRLPPGFQEDSLFSNMDKAILLDPEENSAELQDLGFSPNLEYYLVKYLRECAKAIRRNLLSEEKRALIGELLTVHENLFPGVPVYKLNTSLMNFISNYHSSLGQAESADTAP